jgi:hypothetical protein
MNKTLKEIGFTLLVLAAHVAAFGLAMYAVLGK